MNVFAVCNGGVPGGRCESGLLTVTRPSEATQFDAGDSVAVAATFSLPDGGAWPSALSIPVTATWGAATTVVGGTPGAVAGSASAGFGRILVGWDGGPSESRSVSFVSCVASCDGYQRCISSADGGFCATLPLTVSVTQPPNDGVYTNASSVPLEVTVVSADGGMPAAIPLTGPNGTVVVQRDSATSSTYSTTLSLSGSDGQKRFIAGWDAGVGFSAARVVTRDTTPPTVNVVVQSAPARDAGEADPLAGSAWKKDESVLVAVTVTDATSPVNAVTAAMVAAPGGATVTSAPGACGACVPAAGCSCFRVPLEKLPIPGARTMATVAVSGVQDVATNSGSGTSAAFQVTRFKWVRTFSGGFSRPVAIGDGGVVVAAASDFSAGRVTAYAQNGSQLWEVSNAGAITAGPAVGSSVWVGTRAGINIGMTPLGLVDGVLGPARCTFKQDPAERDPFLG